MPFRDLHPRLKGCGAVGINAGPPNPIHALLHFCLALSSVLQNPLVLFTLNGSIDAGFHGYQRCQQANCGTKMGPILHQ